MKSAGAPTAVPPSDTVTAAAAATSPRTRRPRIRPTVSQRPADQEEGRSSASTGTQVFGVVTRTREPKPLSAKEVQQLLLEGDTLLLEFALGEERSYLWAVTGDSITGHELPKRAEIEATARKFYELVKKAEAEEAQVAAAAADLSRMLLAPVSDRLTAKRLVVVADGVLHYIPFAALPASETGRRGDGATGRRGDGTPDR